ncbi:MAG: hypothetical protein ACYSX0_02265, partial [Planctomycetota bacterium]
YNELVDVFGVEAADLVAKDQIAPKGEVIRKKVRGYLNERVKEMRKRGEAILSTKNYQVQPAKNVIIAAEGEKAKITLYGTPLSEDTITVRGMLDGLPEILAFAAKVMKENNEKFHEEFARYETRITTLQGEITQKDSQYKSDIEEKQRMAEGWKSDLDETRTQLQETTQKIDDAQTKNSQQAQDHSRALRLLQREKDAWMNRAINEKVQKELALKEDPKDGEVLAASKTRGTVFVNLGRRQRLSSGTKFKVWRPGKGNIRQDIAVVRIIKVGETSSEARVVQQINTRVPVTRGMNISNPFFDAVRPLKAYIWGDLKRYTTDLAARRLAAAGVVVSKRLDDTVNIIILGEPPITAEEEMPEDETEAAAVEKRQRMERDKRLTEVMRIATSIQALVVTETSLSTFIDY